MGNISQQDSINLLKGIADGNVVRGDKSAEGSVSDADYAEVSGRGDENGSGCDGVPSSPESSSGGDETPVRES